MAKSAVPSPHFTLEETAEYIRIDQSAPKDPVSAVRRLIADGELRAFKVGRRLFVMQKECDRYLREREEYGF